MFVKKKKFVCIFNWVFVILPSIKALDIFNILDECTEFLTYSIIGFYWSKVLFLPIIEL